MSYGVRGALACCSGWTAPVRTRTVTPCPGPGAAGPACGTHTVQNHVPGRRVSLLQLQVRLPQITEVPGTRGAGSRHRYGLWFITA